MAVYHIPDLRVSSKLPDDLPASAQVQRPRSLAPSSGLGCLFGLQTASGKECYPWPVLPEGQDVLGEITQVSSQDISCRPALVGQGARSCMFSPAPTSPDPRPGLWAPGAHPPLCGWGPQPPGCWYPQPLYLLLATAVPSWDTLLPLQTMSPAWWGHFWDPLGPPAAPP